MGDVIDDYRVDEVLGVGGMGSVVAATHLPTGERRALKRVLPRHLDNPEVLARFEREVRAAQALQSERVVRVYGLERASDGAPLMVMELLTGTNFDKLWRARGPLPIREAVGYTIEVCEAIAEAHAAGIIHRDLKPANLFLATRPGAPPIVKVLDFGISKITPLDQQSEASTLTETDSNLGSPTYMSPEQVRSAKRVDLRTDLWALGLILYRLLTAQPAFPASSVGEHLLMIVSEPPTPLRRHRPDAPRELEAAINRCLQRDPERRFPTVAHLVEALAPFAPAECAPLVEAITRMPAPPSAPHPPRIVDDPTTVAEGLAAKVVGATAQGEEEAPPSLSQQTTVGLSRRVTRRPPEPTAVASRARYVATGAVAVTLAIGAAAIATWGSGGEGRISPASPSGARSGSAQIPSAITATSEASAPAAPVTPPAPSASAAAPLVEAATIRIEVTPAGASLLLDGAPVSEAPLRLRRGSGPHRLLARAPGYLDEERTLSADGDSDVSITLRRAARAAPGQPPQPSTAAPRPPDPAPSAPNPPAKLKGPVETTF